MEHQRLAVEDRPVAVLGEEDAPGRRGVLEGDPGVAAQGGPDRENEGDDNEEEEKQDFYGMSFCVSPEGELLGPPTGMKEGIALIDIDLKQIPKVRKEWPFSKDRRPEIYGEICQEFRRQER